MEKQKKEKRYNGKQHIHIQLIKRPGLKKHHVQVTYLQYFQRIIWKQTTQTRKNIRFFTFKAVKTKHFSLLNGTIFNNESWNAISFFYAHVKVLTTTFLCRLLCSAAEQTCPCLTQVVRAMGVWPHRPHPHLPQHYLASNSCLQLLCK